MMGAPVTDFLDIQQLKSMRRHSKSNSHKLEKGSTATERDNTDLKVSRKERKPSPNWF